MGTWVATNPDTGQKLKATGEQPPTEAEWDNLFAESEQTLERLLMFLSYLMFIQFKRSHPYRVLLMCLGLELQALAKTLLKVFLCLVVLALSLERLLEVLSSL